MWAVEHLYILLCNCTLQKTHLYCGRSSAVLPKHLSPRQHGTDENIDNIGCKVAKMIEIQSKCMKIMYDNKIATIDFQKEISEEEIHDTLVSMAKAIK